MTRLHFSAHSHSRSAIALLVLLAIIPAAAAAPAEDAQVGTVRCIVPRVDGAPLPSATVTHHEPQQGL